jgi:hypothetical protein
VKYTYSLYPKKWLKITKESYLGRPHVVIKSTKNGEIMLAFGYKYSSKKCYVSLHWMKWLISTWQNI